MAVHVPLTIEAQLEARALMMSTNNILSPANGAPIINPSQDVVLGLYYMTRDRFNSKGEGRVFSNPDEVLRAFETETIDLQASIKVRIVNADKGSFVEQTTVGRVLVWRITPAEVGLTMLIRFWIKRPSPISLIFHIEKLVSKKTVIFADQLMYLGFDFSTRSGSSIGVDDFIIPEENIRSLKLQRKRLNK